MRNVTLAILTSIPVLFSATMVATAAPSYSQCHTLAEQRGAGHASGMRNHESFIRACLAGRVPNTVPRVTPSQRSVVRGTYASCHALAEQRGAGHANGMRNHEAFIQACMAGRVSAGPPASPSQRNVVRGTYASCHALAEQRGSGHASGMRNHEAFIRSCMAGRVS